jgi:hypothetical protein
LKIYVQWALRNVRDYQLRDSSEWSSLPFKADPQLSGPTGDSLLDNAPGWLAGVGIQGIDFSGYDHTVVEDLQDGSGGILVSVWQDNLTTNPPGSRFAQVWTILPLAPDDRFGGALNTRQTQVIYTEGAIPPMPWPQGTVYAAWSGFSAPLALARHGIWLSDAKYTQLVAARSSRGWREWAA